MNLIEEAAKRLQQLEHAGIAVPAREPLPQQVARDPLLQQVARAAVRARAQPAAAPLEDKRVEPMLPEEAAGRNFCKIDLARLQAAGFITPALPESRLLHEFRVIK